MCSARLKASSGLMFGGVPTTIRGDKDQDPVASEEVWTRPVIQSPPPC